MARPAARPRFASGAATLRQWRGHAQPSAKKSPSPRKGIIEHPPYFPKDELSDKPERFFASEFLREAIFEQYRNEVPYSCEVVVDAFKETDEMIRIRADIFVSHESQKGIVGVPPLG